MYDFLKGVRVIEFARYWAGPYCARLLADMGAEVIKVESPIGDRMRGGLIPAKGSGVYPNDTHGERPYNRQGVFNMINRNKLAVSIALDTEEGNALFKELVKTSDVVVNNMVPGTLEKLGIGYEDLIEIKPDIIMAGMNAYGSTGPESHLRGLGVTIEPYSLVSISGYEDEDIPMKSGVDHMDPLTATHVAGAIMTALLYRQRTGKGQLIDGSMIESSICVIGQAVMEYTMNSRLPAKQGNSHPFKAPHGCYQCQGEEKWITIAVSSDEEWEAMKLVMGNPVWADQDKFGDMPGRWENQDELNRFIEDWTIEQDAGLAARLLQKEGVAAGPTLNTAELLEDAHLKEREFFETLDHPESGSYPHFAPLKVSGKPAKSGFPAPCFAEHNHYVFHELLGLSTDIIDDLLARGIIYDNPIPWITRKVE